MLLKQCEPDNTRKKWVGLALPICNSMTFEDPAKWAGNKSLLPQVLESQNIEESQS